MNKQNPFSIYDFLGYLIPRGLLIYSILIGKHLHEASELNLDLIIDKYGKVNFGEVFIFVIVAYSLGHLLSFLSALTVETYTNRLYDYPSRSLLGFKQGENAITLKSILLIIFLLPIVALEYIFSNVLELTRKIHKPIDPFLRESIIYKTKLFLKKLDLLEISSDVNHETKEFDFDFHRIITHYTYETSKQHQTRMTNYVALYGFLRNLALLFNVFSWVYIFFILKGINFNYGFSFDKIAVLFLLIGSAYIAFLAFNKFYRRYTLEGFMLIIVDESLKK